MRISRGREVQTEERANERPFGGNQPGLFRVYQGHHYIQSTAKKVREVEDKHEENGRPNGGGFWWYHLSEMGSYYRIWKEHKNDVN